MQANTHTCSFLILANLFFTPLNLPTFYAAIKRQIKIQNHTQTADWKGARAPKYEDVATRREWMRWCYTGWFIMSKYHIRLFGSLSNEIMPIHLTYYIFMIVNEKRRTTYEIINEYMLFQLRLHFRREHWQIFDMRTTESLSWCRSIDDNVQLHLIIHR